MSNSTAAVTTPASIVFVDSSVAGYQQIIDSVPAGDTVVVIDGSKDGVQQITDYLATTSNVGAIHIVSHGADGELQIGTSDVNAATLSQYSAQLASWKSALAPGADLLLYGCSIAADGAGQQFVDQIAGLTGADVAASSDHTGGTAVGGNWNLEFATGAVTAPALNDAGYDGLLSHFRASSLTWTPIGGVGNAVQFSMQMSFRESAYNYYKTVSGTALTAAPVVGQIISVSLYDDGQAAGRLNFGDGQSTAYYVKVTAINTAQDYFVGDMVSQSGQPILHVYPSPGPFTASFEDSARLNTLSNFAGDSFRSQTLVDPGQGNSPPVSSLPPIVQVAQKSLFQIQIPAIDPNGDKLTYAIGTVSQFISNQAAYQKNGLTGATLDPSALVAPTGVTLSSSGQLTWDLTNNTTVKAGQQYVMTVVVSDVDSMGKVKSTTPLDFILQVVDTTTSKPPVFQIVPPAQTVIAGVAAEVQLTALDPQGALVNIQALNPITGMTTTYHGDEGELHVDLTPTAAEIGTTSIVNFQALDNLGLTSQTSVAYTVKSPVPVISIGTPGALHGASTEVIGTVAAAQAGDTLILSQAPGSQGTVSLGGIVNGVQQILYTAPTNVSASSYDAVSYTISDVTLAGQLVPGSNLSTFASAAEIVPLVAYQTVSIDTIAGDNVVNGAEAASGVIVTGTTTNVADGQPVSLMIGGVYSVGTVNGNHWSAALPPGLADGPYTVTASVTDQLGFTSTTARPITIDTTISTPMIAFAASNSAEGAAAVNAAHAAALGYIVSGVDSDAVETVTFSGVMKATGQFGTVELGTPSYSAGGSFVRNGSFTLPFLGTFFQDGAITATITEVDQAGNRSATTRVTTLLDTTISTPTITFAATNSAAGPADVNAANANAAGFVVNSIDADATASVTFTGVSKSTGLTASVTSAVGNGPNSIDLSGFADGTISAVVTATDAVGNSASAAPVTTILDTTVSTPTLAFAATNSAAGSADVNAAQASAAGFVVSGVDPDATASVTFTGVSKATGQTASVTVAAANGAQAIDLSGFNDGTITATLNATDAAGNSTSSAPVTTILDTTVSTPTIMFGNNSLSGPAYVNAISAAQANYAVGGVDPDATAIETFTGVSKATGQTVSVTRPFGNGQSSVDLSDFADGTISAAVTATDAAGNSATSAPITTILDTTISTPTISFAATNSAAGAADINAANAKAAAYVVNGLDPDEVVDVIFTGVSKATGQVISIDQGATTNGARTIDLNGFKDGTITTTFTGFDYAGNSVRGAGASALLDTTISTPTIAFAAGNSAAGAADVNAANAKTAGYIVGGVDADAAATVTFTGVSKANGQTVSVTGAATNGAQTIDLSGFKDGTVTASITDVDAAGNTAAGSATTALLDTTISTPTIAFAAANSAVGAADINAAHAKTAAYTVGGVDSDATATVTFTGVSKTSGQTVSVTGAATNGAQTIDLSGFKDGTVTASITDVDAAGNTAAGSATTALLDTTISTPTIAFAAANSAVGAADINAAHAKTAGYTVGGVDSDATATVTFTGVSKASGQTVSVTGAATNGGQTIDLSGFKDGTVTASITDVDAAGNTAAGSATTALLDTTISNPTIAFAAANSAVGAADINAAHAKTAAYTVGGVDADATATVTFTGVSKASGQTVSVTGAATNGAQTIDLSGFKDGTVTASITDVDAAGNSAAGSATTALLDTTISTPTIAFAAANSAVGAADINAAHAKTAAYTVGGVDADATATVTFTGVSKSTGQTVSVTGAATNGAQTIDLSGFKDGTVSATITDVDAAGNSAAGAPLGVILDTQAPVVSARAPAATIDATSSAGASVSFSGSAADTTDGAISGLAYTETLADGTSKVVRSGDTFGFGTHTIIAKATDKAGNIGSTSFSFSVVDPARDAPTLTAASDTGASQTDAITRCTTPVLTGFAKPGSTVVLYDGNTIVGGGVADKNGAYTVVSTCLAAGTHALSVQASDRFGNSSGRSAVRSVTIDTAPPATPAAPTLDTASDSGISASDAITKVSTPTFAGKVEAGATVTISDGVKVVGTGVADATSGAYAVKVAGLSDGLHAISVTATDIAGNISCASAAKAVLVDTVAPSAPAAPTLAAASDSGVSACDGVTKVKTPVLTGTAEANALVTLYDTDRKTVLGTTTASSTGAYAITSAALSDGTHILTVTATDKAGNVSVASAGKSVVIDTLAPTASTPQLTAASDSGVSSSDGITKVTKPVFAGTAEAGSTVTLYDGTKVVGSGIASTAGAYSITSAALADGTHNMSTTVTDVADNVSAMSAAKPIVIDTIAQPVAITSKGGSTTTAAQTITGTGEAGASITLTDNGKSVGTATVGTNGIWSGAITLSSGSNGIVANEVDKAGNVAASGSVAYSLNNMVQAMSTMTSSSSSSSTPTASSSSQDAHPLAAAHA